MKYQHIMARALNRPLLLEPGYARVFFSGLGPRFNIAELNDVDGNKLDKAAQVELAAGYLPRVIDPWTGADKTDESYPVLNGIAVIDVSGSLVHNGGYVGSKSGCMGYDGIQAQLESAEDNGKVKGIMLRFDSPGGEVSGVQALATVIGECQKPVWGHANEQAASAACWLISACDRVMLAETAEIGSIGVVMGHCDYSEMLAAEGLKVTLIHAGAHKVDGNPYEPLPADVLASFQGELDELRLLFATAVATGRGIETSQVLATEARMYRGQAAVDQGLADSVMSFDDAMASFSATVGQTGNFTKGKTMTPKVNTSASPNAGENNSTITPEAHTAALATAHAEGHAEGVSEGVTQGAAAERARISAILTHENAAGREATAREFALGTDMTAESAIKVLASVPKGAGIQAGTLAQMGEGTVVGAEGGAANGGQLTLAQRNQAAKATLGRRA
ncbi:MAG TPA: S49 family peptidase [Polaromonas sp.]|uniref:S49 family peptidase n=1 Tax=Polaromonas sp. TaxID=1869339 RepID=UPI002D397EAD|nr:S49 family peptidase [Polaromonas sp.]HYW57687.1 S49 family peptidase [Polaromonas sp.]